MSLNKTFTGDVANAGGGTDLQIQPGVIVNADVNASAAIAPTKLDLTALVAAIDSTSIASTGTTLVREALTGEVTAATNVNTTAIVRSTAFTWTGSHTFAGAGTAFAVNVDNASSIDVASTFALVSSGSSTFTLGADSSISVTGSLDILASTDVTLDADGDVFVLGSGILQVGDGVIEGYIRMQASTASAPTVSSNEGMFWVFDPGSADTMPSFTDDNNVDTFLHQVGASTVISVSGTVNNAPVTNKTAVIRCTAATTLNGVTAGYEGQGIDVVADGNFDITVTHSSTAATGAVIALPSVAGASLAADSTYSARRGGVRIVYVNGAWRGSPAPRYNAT